MSMRSISSRVMASGRRSYNRVVFGSACPAKRCAVRASRQGERDRDAGASKGVSAKTFGRQSGLFQASLNHRVGFCACQAAGVECFISTIDAGKERPLEIVAQILFERVMTGDLSARAPFFRESHPEARVTR